MKKAIILTMLALTAFTNFNQNAMAVECTMHIKVSRYINSYPNDIEMDAFKADLESVVLSKGFEISQSDQAPYKLKVVYSPSYIFESLDHLTGRIYRSKKKSILEVNQLLGSTYVRSIIHSKRKFKKGEVNKLLNESISPCNLNAGNNL